MSEGNVDTLMSMFGEQGWDRDSLKQILADSGDDVEVALDAVLAAGSPVAWSQQRLRPAGRSTNVVAAPAPAPIPPPPPVPANALSVVVPANARAGGTLRLTHKGQSFLVDIPEGVGPGQRFMATLPSGPAPPREARRGRRVTLPEDFLRLPSQTNETVLSDQQLAMMLQQEAYNEEDQLQEANRRRRNLLASSQQQRSTERPRQNSSDGAAAMLASVGATMRAGFTSAGQSIKNATNRLTQKQEHSSAEAPLYGRVDLEDEFNDDENPLHHQAQPPYAPPPYDPNATQPPPAFHSMSNQQYCGGAEPNGTIEL